MTLLQTVILASQHVPSENGGEDVAVVASVSLGFSRDLESAINERDVINFQINDVMGPPPGPVRDFVQMLGKVVPGHCEIRAVVTPVPLTLDSFPPTEERNESDKSNRRASRPS